MLSQGFVIYLVEREKLPLKCVMYVLLRMILIKSEPLLCYLGPAIAIKLIYILQLPFIQNRSL